MSATGPAGAGTAPGPAAALTVYQLRLARYCAAEVLRRRTLTGEPIPPPLAGLTGQLDAAIAEALSAAGPPDVDDPASSELIDAVAAAEIIGCSPRQVRRIAADLDGRRIAGRWLFDHRSVTTYSEGRIHAHGPADRRR